MPTTYDLGQLADHLGHEFPAIQELYLFGSRRFRTRSARSDVDVLVVSSAYIQPLELRDFAYLHCTALDLFLVRDGRATSCQNESYVEAADFISLIRELRAERFWTRSQGRLQADIDWTFSIDESVGFPFTCLPNSPIPNKSAADMTVKELIGGLKPGQLWATVAAVVALIVTAFLAGIWLGSRFPDRSEKQVASPSPSHSPSPSASLSPSP